MILQTFVGRIYNADGLGIYSQILVIYVLATILAGFGVETSTIKHTAENVDNKIALVHSYSTSQFTLLIFSSFISLLLLFLSVRFPFIFSSREVAEGIKFICPGIILFVMNRNANSFLTGQRRMKKYAIARSMRWVLIILFTIIFIFAFPHNLNILLAAYSISEFLLFLYFLQFNRVYWRLIFSYKWFKIHFNYGSKTILSRLVSDFNSRLGIFLVGYFVGNSAAGVYSYIATFAQSFLIISSAIQQNFNPYFAAAYSRGEHIHIKRSIVKVLRFILPAIPIMFLLSIIGYRIYTSLFLSDDFDNTTVMYATMSLGLMIFLLYSWIITTLPMAGFLNENLARILIGFVLNIILLSFMIHYFNLWGAIIATGLIFIFHTGIAFYFINKYLKLNLYNLTIISVKDLSRIKWQ